MITCCGAEMYEAGIFLHCLKCHKKLVVFPQGQTRGIITYLLTSELDGLGMSQKEFLGIMREVWRVSNYEDYDGKIDPMWEPISEISEKRGDERC